MIRVLVVDDSPTARQVLVEILRSDPEISVVGEAATGQAAIELAARLKPDLITMDVYLPDTNGITVTTEIMAATPTPILVISAAQPHEVELSLRAMQAGALMAIGKPGPPGAPEFVAYRDHLVAMAHAMADVRVVRIVAAKAERLRRVAGPVQAVAIASSTGGPAALQQLLQALNDDFAAPILVVQHIANGFVQGLADWLGGTCRLRVKVAQHGEDLRPSVVYIAPDDRQLGIASDRTVQISEAPAVNGFRPSATYLFESFARAYGPAGAAVVLTGMGDDGVAGLMSVRAAGGLIFAQDEASSVVYGMPRVAVRAGIVDAQLPPAAIASQLIRAVHRRP